MHIANAGNRGFDRLIHISLKDVDNPVDNIGYQPQTIIFYAQLDKSGRKFPPSIEPHHSKTATIADAIAAVPIIRVNALVAIVTR